MDESGTIQAQPLGCIKICVAAIKLLRLKSLTFWGHLIVQKSLSGEKKPPNVLNCIKACQLMKNRID